MDKNSSIHFFFFTSLYDLEGTQYWYKRGPYNKPWSKVGQILMFLSLDLPVIELVNGVFGTQTYFLLFKSLSQPTTPFNFFVICKCELIIPGLQVDAVCQFSYCCNPNFTWSSRLLADDPLTNPKISEPQ